jgi:hypothetical protein
MEITEEQLRAVLLLAESMDAINFVEIKFEIRDTILVVTQTFRIVDMKLPYFGLNKDLGIYEKITEIKEDGEMIENAN